MLGVGSATEVEPEERETMMVGVPTSPDPGPVPSRWGVPRAASAGARGAENAAPTRPDLTARSVYAEEIRRRQVGSLLKLSPQAIVILDVDGCIREWNPAAVELLGWARTQMLGVGVGQWVPASDSADFAQVWADLLVSREARAVSMHALRQGGDPLSVELYLAPIQDVDGSFAGVVATVSGHADGNASAAAADDATPAGAAPGTRPDRGLTALEVDDLTGLPGRRWLQRRLAEPVPSGQERAMALLDVDAFALVNQDYGPDAGDDVLREVGARLSSVCGPASLGRWQADEFLLVLDQPGAATVLSAVLAEARHAVRRPYVLVDGPIRLSVSAGVASSAQLPPSLLFSAASVAMAAAKGRGRDCVVQFEGEAPRADAPRGLRMADDLRRGLAAGEMRLHFQPIIELSTNDVVGVEALVRWQRPGVGLLAPGAFIDVAERTGQIVALGEWVIREACQAAADLAGARLAPLQVSINVSARQLGDAGLVEVFASALRDSATDPTSIVVEVTETALLHDLGAATAVLEAIQGLGIDLDLDDFGTGYSSLLYLKHFPVSRIKIDRSFVAGLGADVADTAIVASTIALAHSVGLTAIAEGVETARQLTMLRQMGCDFAQGYLVSHPLPRDELTTWLNRQVPARLLSRSTEEAASELGASSTGGSTRDHAADRRDYAGDWRDAAGEERDNAGNSRDIGADERDQAGDQRDNAADLRDDAAHRRDKLADQRDRAADRRDVAAAPTLGTSEQVAPPASEELQIALAQSATARKAAAVDRSLASYDRQLGAQERLQAERDRDVAMTDRGAGAEGRTLSGLDRLRAQADRVASAQDRRATSTDALTGAYLRDAGMSLLQAAAAGAREHGEILTVAHLRATGPGATAAEDSQMNEDALMILLANAIGTCLRQADVLIRYEAAQFLCILVGVTRDDAVERLKDVHTALAGPPPFGVVSIGYASLMDDEPVEALIERALADVATP
ncbi:MAG: hypothetical protein NVS3B26_17240 [Mycobacteriales bacterium]